MSSLYKFFSYNFFKVFVSNFRNNSVRGCNHELFRFLFFKEFFNVVFCILIFLSSYFGLRDLYLLSHQGGSFFYFFKDNFLSFVVWFFVLSILPIISCIFNRVSFKSKYYLFLVLFYLLSNLFNCLMLVYFIFSFSNCILIGILGILNIFINILINIKFIVSLVEFYLE